MVIEYDVELEKDVDLSILQIAPEEILAQEGGLPCNQDYFDHRGWFDWEHWKISYKIENKYVLKAEEQATSLDNLDDLFGQMDNKLHKTGEIDDIYFELGISSIIISLYVAGCFPMTSCRGKSHREDMPHVAFYATKKTARKLVELLQDQPVGIWNASIEGFNGLALYARRASSLLEFSKILSENRDSFGWA